MLPLRLRTTDPMVPRRELLASPELHHLEVLRMPAGSNPSFIDRNAWHALRELFPQVTGLLRRSGVHVVCRVRRRVPAPPRLAP